MKSTLILNATYEPLNVVPVKRAIQLVLSEKAIVEDESFYVYHTAESQIMPLPYVIRMRQEIKINRKKIKPIAFQRKGVLVRDNYTCVYCGKYGNTIDHIIPTSLGGETSYANCVAACQKCNNKKSNKTLEQLGWRHPNPKPMPKENRYARMLTSAQNDPDMFEIWLKYISWFDVSFKTNTVGI